MNLPFVIKIAELRTEGLFLCCAGVSTAVGENSAEQTFDVVRYELRPLLHVAAVLSVPVYAYEHACRSSLLATDFYIVAAAEF